MDYSRQQFFGGPQPYQFMSMPPLTPSNSHSAGSDDFNTTSPPEVFDPFPSEQQQYQAAFDGAFPTQFNQTTTFPGPPTPPSNNAITTQQVAQPLLNGAAQVKQHTLDGLSIAKVESSGDEQRNAQQAYNQSRRGQSNSDEDDLTPAQSRRKAQNRAAQRAFRERKERHVKDLEQRLANLEESQQIAVAENERLKQDLQKISTENEILRATSGLQNGHSNSSLSPEPTTTGPMHYNPTDFYSNVLSNHANKTPSHRIVTSDDGERLLAVGAAWDLIISHDLYKRGLVDIGDVSERIKNQAKCDGQGPVFSERDIIKAIESSVASGSDELL
ncbi:hypothetical protein SAPIO_CDS6640 [Scedosporium apiospermum]|uniref:BZIP domain-containing protein n=1 Tax=Pseudallescheria apiosperma TaxID=563466 RepID=A0A084G3C2_PSEDA|nr:uncharacterized protein SAPIO_CDS6640 [Scedosporium apiospermum]KEZ41834.1 hypothetical protein SAPIO_CDS6640 [Scedosporium apiospermum]